MKIVFLSDDFPPISYGGAGISTYGLAQGMRDAGHDVFVITTCREEKNAGETDYNGLKVFKIASNYNPRFRWYKSLNNPQTVKQVENILKKIKPDIVHINNVHFYLSYATFKIAKQFAPAVWTARDVMSFNYNKLQTKRYLEHFDYKTTWLDHLKQAKKRWNPFRNILIKKYLKFADKRLAVSVALKDALHTNGIDDVQVIHTGIDSDEFVISNDLKEQTITTYKLQNKKVILFSGRLSAAKGGAQALKSFSIVAKSIPDAVLLVAGKIDDYAKYMQAEAKKMGIEEKLIFTGWVGENEMKNIYGVSDIVLVPSICFDSLPRTVLEAMAAGKPVVGTIYGGTKELIEDGITGHVVNPFKVDVMAEKLIDLLKDPGKAKQFGQAGYERVKTDFNLGDKVRQTLQYYQELLNKR